MTCSNSAIDPWKESAVVFVLKKAESSKAFNREGKEHVAGELLFYVQMKHISNSYNMQPCKIK